jgi:predicted tellurium resistance membrane protein TerC
MLTLAAETAGTIAPLFSVESAIALLTLTALEIVLGIDNIVFISILTGKLPEEQRAKARRMGLAVALIARIALLLTISWIMKLQKPLFTIPAFWPFKEANAVSGKDLVLIIGGLFLIVKATKEIHHKIDGHEGASGANPDPARRLGAPRYGSVILQIMLIDIVFSLDSVITAVGMADHVPIMITAVIIAVAVMMLSVNLISNFVEKNPTIKMLALAFLLLIGVMLVGDGIDQHLPKGMIYFAMAFSLGVEFLNMRAAAKAKRSPNPA